MITAAIIDSEPQGLESLFSQLPKSYKVSSQTRVTSFRDQLLDPEIRCVFLDHKTLGTELEAFAQARAILRPDLRFILIADAVDKALALKSMRLQIDDILEKPFPLEELVACLDRCGLNSLFCLNEEKMTLLIEGREYALTPIEFKIIRLLGRPMQKLDRNFIIKYLWGQQKNSKNTFDTHLSNLKKKIPEMGRWIRFSDGHYTFEPVSAPDRNA